MTRRRALNGVAYGLVETCVSRNNDVTGYWGIGQLYREALERHVSSVSIELLCNSSLAVGSVVQAIQLRYTRRLEQMALNAGVSRSHAQITVEFGAFGSSPADREHSDGDPFLCTVSLVGSSGRAYKATRAGRCSPHDPRREIRSTRARDP